MLKEGAKAYVVALEDAGAHFGGRGQRWFPPIYRSDCTINHINPTRGFDNPTGHLLL